MKTHICTCVATLAVLAAVASGCAVADHAGVKGGKLVPFAKAGATQAETGKRYAVVVGINDFDDERFNDLLYARDDAREMASALAHFDDVQLLISPEQTTRSGIQQALEKLATKASGLRDTIVIYVSSHGTLARRPGGALERYLVTRDTNMSNIAGTSIELDEMIQAIDGLTPKRKAVVLAMCHSGAGKSGISDELADALAKQKGPASVPPLEDVSEAMVVVSAASAGEAAREDKKLGHDIYTHFLLEALEKGDRDGDGAVTISEAHDFARERTYLYSSGNQRPTAETTVLGNDPIVLAGKRRSLGKTVLYSYDASSEGVRVVVDGATKGVLPGGVAVSEGSHTLRLEDASTNAALYEGEFEAQLGEQIELASLIGGIPQNLAAVGAGLASPVSSEVRGHFIPSTPNLVLHLAHRFARESGLSVALEGSIGTRDAGSGLDAFSYQGMTLEGFVGWSWVLESDVALTPSVGGGMLSADRELGSGTNQSLIGWTGIARLDAAWHVAPGVAVLATIDGGYLRARLGSEDLHAIAGAHLGAGWSF